MEYCGESVSAQYCITPPFRYSTIPLFQPLLRRYQCLALSKTFV